MKTQKTQDSRIENVVMGKYTGMAAMTVPGKISGRLGRDSGDEKGIPFWFSLFNDFSAFTEPLPNE